MLPEGGAHLCNSGFKTPRLFSPVCSCPNLRRWQAGGGLKIAFDEMKGHSGVVREPYRFVQEWLAGQKTDDLARKRTQAEALFRRTGITFAVYGDEAASERLIPFDIIPRI